MFCNNCGKQLPDGSKFCNACGARLAEVEMPVERETPAADRGFYQRQMTDADNSRQRRVSFDWSNVTDEPVRKVVPEVRSPWDDIEPEEAPAVSRSSSQDHSQTLNFIEILKQERAEKMKSANIAAQPVTDKVETSADYAAFDKAPAYYVPPMYDTEPLAPAEPVYEEPKYEPAESFAPQDLEPKYEPAESFAPQDFEPKFEEPKYEEPKYEEPVYDSSIFEVPVTASAPVENTPEPLFAEAEEKVQTPVVEPVAPQVQASAPVVEEYAPVAAVAAAEAVAPAATPEPVAPAAETSVNYDEYFKSEADMLASDTSNLMDQLNAILGESSGRVSRAQRNAELERELAEQEAAEQAPAQAPAVETVAPAVVNEEPATTSAESDLESYIDFGNSVNPMQARSTVAPPADNESEVEALKRRLAELTGTQAVVEETSPLQSVQPVTIAVAEPAVETPVVVAEPVAEAPAVAVEPAVEAPVVAAEPVVETPVVAAEPVAEPAVEAPVVAAEPVVEAPVVAPVESVVEPPMLGEATSAPEATVDLADFDLEKELFGDAAVQDVEAEATKKIDKFYTLYKKNEEFQRLLDEEYNKLKTEDAPAAEPVPVVSDQASFESGTPVVMPAAQAENVNPVPAVPEIATPAEPVAPVAEEGLSKAEAKAAKKAAKAEAKAAKKAAKEASKNQAEEDDEEESGGGALTVIAVIIAVILVVLLSIILILNFAPDSGIAIKIDSLIENVASYFSVVDPLDGKTLL